MEMDMSVITKEEYFEALAERQNDKIRLLNAELAQAIQQRDAAVVMSEIAREKYHRQACKLSLLVLQAKYGTPRKRIAKRMNAKKVLQKCVRKVLEMYD